MASNKVNDVTEKICREWKVQTNVTSDMRSRFWLVWQRDFYKVQVELVHKQIMHAYVQHLSTQYDFYVSVVHASNCAIQRRILWEIMESRSNNITEPWVIAGDVNWISTNEESLGGAEVPIQEMEDFRGRIEAYQL